MDLSADQPQTPTKPAAGKRHRVCNVFLVILAIAGVALLGWRLSWPSFASPAEDLSYRVTELVKNDRLIRNDVLYVLKGDGSFSWSGAAGIAQQEGQVPMTAATPFYMASTTKLYTAVAIMRLAEQGALALDDPMAKYLPDELIAGLHTYQGHDYSHEITIAQLLNHTSGIADYYEDQGPDGKRVFDLFIADQGRAWSPEELIARARDELQPHFAPNATQAYYSDTNYLLLGKIIEAVTGKPLQDVYAELFFQPLGLTHTWLSARAQPQDAPAAAPAEVFSNDTDITRMRAGGSYWADGGLVSTAEDMVHFLKALNEGRIITPESLALMHQWNPIQNLGPFAYGYGTLRFALPGPLGPVLGVPSLWGHNGSVSAFLYYAPEQDVYLAGTVNQKDGQAQALTLVLQALAAVR
ncbi:MAG: beta-lactamase family protein [Chloroflexales bacterium]|nr:beta-lactamase family protein [Chloroflexales bacterium]